MEYRKSTTQDLSILYSVWEKNNYEIQEKSGYANWLLGHTFLLKKNSIDR